MIEGRPQLGRGGRRQPCALCKVYYQLFDMLNEYVELMSGKCEKKFKNKMGNKIKRQINYFKNKLKCSNLQYTDMTQW